MFEVLAEARLIVSCQTRFNPSDLEWDRWMMAASVLARQVGDFKLLVVTDGGHPTRAQLERLKRQKEQKDHKEPPTAIVSSSVALRFMGAALTFVNSTIRCFAPAQLDQAFEHIRLAPADRNLARTSIERLRREMLALSA